MWVGGIAKEERGEQREGVDKQGKRNLTEEEPFLTLCPRSAPVTSRALCERLATLGAHGHLIAMQGCRPGVPDLPMFKENTKTAFSVRVSDV